MGKFGVSKLIENKLSSTSKNKECKSLNDIIKEINKIINEMLQKSYIKLKYDGLKHKDIIQEPRDEIWFRGVHKLKYKLVPASYREPTISYDKGWELIDIFESYIPMFLKKGNFIEPKNIYDNYFLAQHYGMRTRLLDWTRSLSTSIFFSIYEYLKLTENLKITKEKCDCNDICLFKKKCNYPIIWVLNASVMNEVFHDISHPLIPDLKNQSHKWFIKEDIPENPLAIFPSASNERILAQQAVFTIHGRHENSLDELLEHNLSFHYKKYEDFKIIDFVLIDPNSIQNIIEDLTLLGINEMTEFPELQSVTRYIMREFNKPFNIKKFKN